MGLLRIWVSGLRHNTITLYDLPDELPCKPQEGLLEVVVGLRRDLEVLDVLLPVESDLAGLNFPLLYRVIQEKQI